MKQTINQIIHKQSRLILNVDIDNMDQLMQFCVDMNCEDREWVSSVMGMSHNQLKSKLSEAWFEQVSIDVSKKKW